LRLGVDLGAFGQQQIAIGLMGVSLLGVGTDDDLAVKTARAAPSSTPL